MHEAWLHPLRAHTWSCCTHAGRLLCRGRANGVAGSTTSACGEVLHVLISADTEAAVDAAAALVAPLLLPAATQAAHDPAPAPPPTAAARPSSGAAQAASHKRDGRPGVPVTCVTACLTFLVVTVSHIVSWQAPRPLPSAGQGDTTAVLPQSGRQSSEAGATAQGDAERPCSAAASPTARALSGAGQDHEDRTVHVKQLPPRITEPTLRALFGRFGTVSDCSIHRHEACGPRHSQGRAEIVLASHAEALAAQQAMDGFALAGSKLAVSAVVCLPPW